MGRRENDGSYETAFEALNTFVKQNPASKPVAVEKIEQLLRELSLDSKSDENGGEVVELSASHDELAPMEKIKKGFLQFKVFFRKEQALFKRLAGSQHPKLMIIACSDSRVDPYAILGLELGEAFVVRNVANVVPPYSAPGTCSSTAAAIEYAVLHLKVEHLLVIGHSRCGGIKALMSVEEDGSNKFSEFIEDWMVNAKHASAKVKKASSSSAASFEDQCATCEKESVNNSLWNCMSYPFVKECVAIGKLALHGARYDFVGGSLELWRVSYEVGEPIKLE